MAHACAGRVLAQLGRGDEAAADFEASVACSNPPLTSVRFTLFEALALREYLRAAKIEFGWDCVAIKNRLDVAMATMPLTMDEFENMRF